MKWVEIPGFSNYEVSEIGCVRRSIHRNPRSRGWSKKRPGDEIRVCYSKAYPYVHIKSDLGKLKTKRVSMLVCTAFHGPSPAGKPNVNHRDDNPNNNHASNVYWGSQKENAADAKRNGFDQTGGASCRSKFSDAEAAAVRARYLAGGITYQKLADEYGVWYSTIRNICIAKTYKPKDI